MSTRPLLVGSLLAALLAAGCGEPAPPAPPAGSTVIQPKKVDAGVQIKKHTVPLGPDPNGVSSGP